MLALGAGTQSLAVVAAGTMLGLAVGNEAGGRLADRRGGGLGLFGALQLSVAAAALLATVLLRDAAELSLPWPLLLLVVALPNALMGATLPVLAPLIARGGAKLGPGLGKLYAANTAGAVAGTLAAGFWLVESFGLFGSVVCASALSAAAGLAGLAFAGKQEKTKPPVHATEKAGGSAALFAAGVSGFGVMALEVLDTRLLIHGFHATTHAFAIILACFIGGLALGAGLLSAGLKKSKNPLAELGAVLLAGAALSLALAPALSRAFGGASASWGIRLATEAVTAAVLLLPSAVVLGLAFPLAAACFVRSDRPGASTGRVFLINTLCAAAGSLAAGFLLPPLLGLRGSISAVAALLALSGAYLAQRRAGWAAGAAIVLGGMLWARPPVIGAPPGEGTLVPEHLMGREADYRVRCYREGALATTEVAEELSTGFRTLFIDGFVTAGESATSSYMALMGSLPMTLHPAPKRALVICLGGGATARAVALWRETALDIVDVNPDVFACAPAFGRANEALLARAQSFVEDGRRFLRRDGPSYDVITQEPMPPYFAGTAALYSVEYYRLARRRLADDGIMAQWLPLHLTAPRDAREIVAAALAVFPETWVALAPGGETAIVISSPKGLDPARRRLAQTNLKAEFILDPEGCRRYAGGTPPVSDDRPKLEYSGVDRVRDRFGSPDGMAAFNIAELRRAASP